MNVSEYIKALGLESHPEGGYYKRVYQSEVEQEFTGFSGKRHLTTAIQYLLDGKSYSAWHRIKSDELWFLSDSNSSLVIHEIIDGQLLSTQLTQLNPCHTVLAGRWFAAELLDKSSGRFALCHCVVSPGFDFLDFELADESDFIKLPASQQQEARSLLIRR